LTGHGLVIGVARGSLERAGTKLSTWIKRRGTCAC
jgi:hypothetical protein